MGRPAAIAGMLVNMRNVGTHKSVALTIHVPEELAQRVIDAFGWPTMVNPVSVALARIETSKATDPEKPHRKWEELPPSQQAAIRCADGEFQRFLHDRSGGYPVGDEAAAEYVRQYCRVKSRSEILPNTYAAKKWRALDDDFFAWRRGMH